MNETDYNDLLYEKAQKEYDDLIAELKELPSEQVIERAYEKVIKENILCILEESQRDQKEAKALYLEKYPLDRAYQDWLKSDVSGTAMLRDSIDDTSKDALKERREIQRESRWCQCRILRRRLLRKQGGWTYSLT